ncbi:MAG: UMP kinase [Candidatus Spechtbacterales bacterium]
MDSKNSKNSDTGDTIVIALGGSIIVSRNIQAHFLKQFRKFILKFLKEGKKFVIVAGGGRVARDYQNVASSIVKLSDEDKDWIGIHATRINAHLLRAIFFDVAHPVVLDNPLKKIKNEEKYNLFIASGWRPGWSTDYVAVLLAHRFLTKRLIISTKIRYVYDDDIEKNKRAKPLKEISWKDYRKMVGDVWTPGLKAPVDPIAAKLAQSLKLEAIVARGTDLANMENILHGKKFRGTVIS